MIWLADDTIDISIAVDDSIVLQYMYCTYNVKYRILAAQYSTH